MFSSEAQHLEELLGRTLTLGESNSALLLAPRGTGKTAVGASHLTAVLDEK